MTLPDSTTLYESIFQSTPEQIRKTFEHEIDENILKQLKEAKRIIFTGSGSSTHAAAFGAHYLQMHSRLPAAEWKSSTLLQSNSLQKGDVVVLVSQGWSRADAALVSRKTLESGASLVVVTGHPERRNRYEKEEGADIGVIPIYPTEEKLFSRPASSITGFASVARLAAQVTGRQIDAHLIIEAWRRGASEEAILFNPGQHLVVLSSGLLTGVGSGIALALQEGAGLAASAHEIEGYGHGWYVHHQYQLNEDKNSIIYLVLKHKENAASQESVQRIKPLIEGRGARVMYWQAEGEAEVAGTQFLARAASWVLKNNLRSGFDMNNPPGKEENLTFHDGEERK